MPKWIFEQTSGDRQGEYILGFAQELLANHDLFIDVKIVYYYIVIASLINSNENIEQKTKKDKKNVRREVHVIINEGLKMLKKELNISKFK